MDVICTYLKIVNISFENKIIWFLSTSSIIQYKNYYIAMHCTMARSCDIMRDHKTKINRSKTQHWLIVHEQTIKEISKCGIVWLRDVVISTFFCSRLNILIIFLCQWALWIDRLLVWFLALTPTDKHSTTKHNTINFKVLREQTFGIFYCY